MPEKGRVALIIKKGWQNSHEAWNGTLEFVLKLKTGSRSFFLHGTRFFSPPVNHVPDSQERMMTEHAGP